MSDHVHMGFHSVPPLKPQNPTSIGNKVLADITANMRSYWISVGPNAKTVVFRRRRTFGQGDRQREDSVNL